MEHKQHESSRNLIHNHSGDYWVHTIQRVTAMAEAKALATILNFLGFSLTGIAIFANLDVFQQTVIWLLVVLFWGAKIYFYVVFSNQKKERNKIEMEIMRKELKA